MDRLLFEPISLGTMKVNNRIAMSPMATNYATQDGEITQRQIKYYEERAKGGVGLIITESCYIHPNGKGGPTRLGLWNDKHVFGFQKLADAVHKYDTRIVAQLHHAGYLAYFTKEFPVSCSNVPSPSTGVIPRCLSVEEIKELVGMYGQAARRAKQAGLNGIEVHAANGYLIHQFLSPLFNKRKDKYGGHLANRMRFLLEIIATIRNLVGDNFPIIVKYSCNDFVEGGLTVQDATMIARVLELSGVNALDVASGVTALSDEMIISPAATSQGHLMHLAKAIKEVVNIPVATVGRIREMGMAEDILQSKKADIICLGRPLIADPELPRKWLEGNEKEIRRCISCNDGCADRLGKGLDISCTVNPYVGKEHDITRAKKSKKVIVIGGGPAGMEAALIASMRGHEVSLFEKDSKLGGQLTLASRNTHKQEMDWVIKDLERELIKQKVSVYKGQEVTVNSIEQLKPEVVVFATGALPSIPSIKGIKNLNVATAHDILSGNAKTGDKVVVIGGGSCGAETAEFLADQGKKVIICEILGDIILDVEFRTRKLMLKRLSEKGVRILINCETKEITSKGLVIKTNEVDELIEANTIVLSVGVKPHREIIDLFKVKGPKNIELYEVGDCVEPRKALEAICRGAEIGEKI